jgi:hypothetical protein
MSLHTHCCCLGSATNKFTCVCNFSKQSTIQRPTPHFLQTYSVLQLPFLSEHIWRLRFPLKGQCCECFISNLLRWDTDGLGLTLEMPLAVTFSSCHWIIKSWTRPPRNFCVMLVQHDLWIRNTLRKATSVRWRSGFLVHFQVLQAIL